MPVITSVTVCSTWMRGFISMKNHSLRIEIEQELDGAGVVVTDFRRHAAPLRRTVPARTLVGQVRPRARSRPLSGAGAARSNRARADAARCRAGRREPALRCAWRAECISRGRPRIAESAARFALRFVEQIGEIGAACAPRACRARRRRTPL